MHLTAVEHSESFSSQYGEDEFLVRHKHVPLTGVFVDVGAGDPEKFSNSYYLERSGWTGVCVEADPTRIKALRRSRACAVEWAAIAAREGEIVFYQCSDPDYSTTLPPSSESPSDRQLAYTRTRVPASTLDAILDRHTIDAVDLLSIDTEGSELEVCDTLDWERHRPHIVLIEYATAGRPSQETRIRTYFGALPYRLIHRTSSNLIFSRTRLPRELRRYSSLRAYLAKWADKRPGY